MMHMRILKDIIVDYAQSRTALCDADRGLTRDVLIGLRIGVFKVGTEALDFAAFDIGAAAATSAVGTLFEERVGGVLGASR